MKSLQPYRPRRIDFFQLAEVGCWKVKVYTITHRAAFTAHEILKNALRNLPHWLRESGKLNLPTYDTAFLIVHEGRDGVWTLINWWLGGEMLQSSTYFTPLNQPGEFTRVPPEGFMACVWELEVVSFERAMWVEYALKQTGKPDLEAYLQKHISQAA